MTTTRDKVRKESRTHNREIHTRAINDRKIESLEVYASRKNSVRDNPIDIPKEWIPHGWTYNWFATSRHGQEDPHNIPARMSQGWFPVPWSRHPQLAPVTEDGSIPVGNIAVKELMLFEKPTIYVQYDMKQYTDNVWRELRSIDSFADRGVELYHGVRINQGRQRINYEDFGPEGPKLHSGRNDAPFGTVPMDDGFGY